MKVRFVLPVTIRKHFSLRQTKEDINCGLFRMHVTHYRISLIIFTSDLVIRYTDKLSVTDGYKLCSSCSRFNFIFTMKEISLLLFLMIIKPILLRHLINL